MSGPLTDAELEVLSDPRIGVEQTLLDEVARLRAVNHDLAAERDRLRAQIRELVGACTFAMSYLDGRLAAMARAEP